MSNRNNVLDSTGFDPEQYIQQIMKELSLKEVMDVEAIIVKDTQTIHSDMQTLVYENYNKFISATDTIRKMKTDFKKMETEMNLLVTNMDSITSFSDQITSTLQDSRHQLNKLYDRHSLLQKLQFLSTLPNKLTNLIENEQYGLAVHDYIQAQRVFKQYGNQASFQGIQEDCDQIINELKIKLKKYFDTNTSAAQLIEFGDLLLQLNEKPYDLAVDMLQNASQRLHDQITDLQFQNEKDMIEFVDLSIEGFLQDLALVVSAYTEMFLRTNLEDKNTHDFELYSNDLNAFVCKNMDKYLNIVQDRVEIETGKGDSEILLRALDRLHRQLLAMTNICTDFDSTKTGIDIIINSAHKLCNYHLKKLKQFFADHLSSIRTSLVTSKGDSNSLMMPNLKESITTLYVSIIEKMKGILQDLLIFLQSDWSFNLKDYPKGVQCIESIREKLLIGFLRHITSELIAYSDVNQAYSPNLYLVLSKTCLEMDKNGIHVLLTLIDDLYEIDSEGNVNLTHEIDICSEMRDTAQILLNSYVRIQGLNISQMLRKSVETRDWLNCLEPRSVRAVMKRVIEELSYIDSLLGNLFENGMRTSASSDSSRKTHLSLTASKQQSRSNWSNWSNFTSSQLESSFVTNEHRLFSERIEIFTPVEFSKVSIITGIVKISLKTLLECVRLKTFSKFGLQQIHVDARYLQINLERFAYDDNLSNFLLNEILSSAVHRCLEIEPNLMDKNAVEIICERV